MLTIKNLHVECQDKKILNGVNLAVKAGEIHAIMGINGSGKSTLSKVLAGHPSYKVTQGEVEYEVNGKMINLLELTAETRAHEGIFLSFQYPTELPGVNQREFLKLTFQKICEHQGAVMLSDEDFNSYLKQKLVGLGIDESFLTRDVHVGFSGGEKKRNEVLQMAVLQPRLGILDEIDSGLDIDALKTVALGLNQLRSQYNAFILVTHYQRLLAHVVPNYVHVMDNGRIVQSGGVELAQQLEKNGYAGIKVA